MAVQLVVSDAARRGVGAVVALVVATPVKVVVAWVVNQAVMAAVVTEKEMVKATARAMVVVVTVRSDFDQKLAK